MAEAGTGMKILAFFAVVAIVIAAINVAVTKTHRGLIAAFGEHLVKTELLRHLQN